MTEEKVKELRGLLYQFERGTVSEIKVEDDNELLQRAGDYLTKFKDQELGTIVVIDRSLFPAVERLVIEIESIRKKQWLRLTKLFRLW